MQKIIYLFFITMIAAFSIAACGESDSPESASKVSTPDIRAMREAPQQLIGCISDDLLTQMTRAFRSNDENAQNHLFKNGCVLIEKGHQITVLDVGFLNVKFRAYAANSSVELFTVRDFFTDIPEPLAITTETQEASPATLPDVKPEQFATVKEILEDIGMHSVTNNTLEVISETPLHIRVSFITIASDRPDAINDELRRAIIYSTYRAFLHTDIDQIKITALPLERMPKPKASKLLASPEYELTITRAKATKVAQQKLGIKTLNDLVAKDDVWAKIFSRAIYNNDEPGLYKFSDALGIKLIKGKQER